MIKFGAKGGKRQLVGLVVTPENIRRLQDGDPIFVFGEEVELPGVDILIAWYPTIEDAESSLRELVGEATRMEDQRKAPKQ